jgi:hypothetical protein
MARALINKTRKKQQKKEKEQKFDSDVALINEDIESEKQCAVV